jgi:hypothetical protein
MIETIIEWILILSSIYVTINEVLSINLVEYAAYYIR